MLGIKNDIFYLKFKDNYFYKGDIITCGNNVKLKVLETPHKKWWKQLIQFITFGLYKASAQYKCKVLEDF
jgi:hypothetical protein